MTYPQAPLGTKIGLQLTSDGPWTDITTYTLQRAGTSPPVTIGRGRPNETSTVNTGSCQMQWKNTDGRFTPGNPTGPYYGQIGRNTPVRVSVPDTTVYLRMEDDAASFISAPDTAGLRITGTIDVRIDCKPSNYQPCVLLSKWGATGTAWALSLNGDGTVTFTWFDGSVNHAAQSTVPLPLPLGRIMVRAVLNTSTNLVTFFTAASMGTGTQLGGTVATGATSISSATGQAVAVGASTFASAGLQGQVYEVQVYSGVGGSGGTLEADPVFTSQTEGATSFTDAQSNTWTLSGTAELSKRSYRFHGECASLPVQWDSTGNDVWTPVSAGGIFRRIQQGNAPVQSPMRRAVGQLASLTGYWPAEDPAGSASITSGLTGGTPMLVSGPATFAGDSNFACSNPVPTISTSRWIGTPSRVTGTAAVMRAICDIPSGAPNFVFLVMNTTGKVYEVDVGNVSGTLVCTGYDSGLNQLFTFSGGSNSAVGQFLISVEIVNSGGNVVATVNRISTAGAVTQVGTSTVTTASAGAVTYVTVNGANANFGSAGIGHIFTQSALTPVANLASPFSAWLGETAGNRFGRLCTENGIAARIYGYPSQTVAMGTQAIDTLTNLLQACEDADHGMQYEPRQCLGLGYRTLRSLCNQSALSLSYTAATLGDGMQGIGVTYDDLYTVNDWTITRNGGGTYEATLNDGSQMSISSPPVGAGDYQSSKTLYLASDGQLADAAGWMLHVSTVSEPRYPAVPLHLARTELSSQFFAIQNAEIGDYVAITSPPAWLPPGNIKQLIAGTREQLGGYHWLIAWQCIPESPYEVLQYDTAGFNHWNTDGSTLSSSATSGATSLSVATTNAGSPLWTTAGGDVPFTIIIDGEVITVTAITGASSPQTFTVTRSTNGVVKAHNSGAAVSVYVPPVWALT